MRLSKHVIELENTRFVVEVETEAPEPESGQGWHYQLLSIALEAAPDTPLEGVFDGMGCIKAVENAVWKYLMEHSDMPNSPQRERRTF